MSAPDTTEAEKCASDLGWKMFELNANQRMTMIRFYRVAIGGIATGIAYLWQANLAGAGLLLSVLGVFASYCFMKLDFRTADLVRLAEFELQRALTKSSQALTDFGQTQARHFHAGFDIGERRQTFRWTR